jgi:hypothetical protein
MVSLQCLKCGLVLGIRAGEHCRDCSAPINPRLEDGATYVCPKCHAKFLCWNCDFPMRLVQGKAPKSRPTVNTKNFPAFSRRLKR